MDETPRTVAAEQLAIIELTRARSWAPVSIPGWYRWGVSLGLGVMLGVQDTDNVVAIGVVLFAYALSLGAMVGRLMDRNGSLPRYAGMPRLLQRAWIGPIVVLFACYGITFGLVWGLDLPRPWLWIAVASAALTFGAMWFGERVYRGAYRRWEAGAVDERGAYE